MHAHSFIDQLIYAVPIIHVNASMPGAKNAVHVQHCNKTYKF